MLNNNHLFCFGLGYSATILADKLLDDGWRVSGTARTMDKCESFRPSGITAHIFDDDIPLIDLPEVQSVTHILISIPPGESGDIVLKHHIQDLKNLRDLKWVGYLSTTGVYGDHDGGWVNEKTSVNPPNERSKRRVLAEQEWLNSGLPVSVFRLSGIYGKGRSAIDALKDGTARRIDKEGQVFSRIHVDDIASILHVAMERNIIGEIFNVADDLPAAQSEVVEYAAKLIDIEPPELVAFEKAKLSDMARSFYMSNRRVGNDKIKQFLGVTLTYPTYKEGLKACIG